MGGMQAQPWVRMEGGILKGRSARLRLAVVHDASFIYALRRDEARNRYLSAISPDVEAQSAWLLGYKERERKGEEYYFIIEDAARAAVGTVRIYDRQGDSFSWGSWIIAPGTPGTIAMESALLVYEFAFGQLGFKRCHFEVRKGNERVIAFHKRFGARETGEDGQSLRFAYAREGYEAVRTRYEKFLPPAP
jgi:RimJ/RimL family protein N-acetyltransferase